MKKDTKNIKAADIQNMTVIGHFEGQCADANITNKNGLDITSEVWETVFASEEYQQAIDLGWYIGFLGHPEDPNCMDFEHACIVMKSGRIDSDGKIYGEFDLIDTPVGRIVKSFIDAGVTFGISVRGAGDIIDNSVDPDTFVFRGFDLVTFPAYPDAIPTFTEIAASSDVDKQQKYKVVCSTVKKNIDGLNTTEAIDIVQSQFAKQSDEYKILESRKVELGDINASIDLTDERLNGMMQLYLNAKHNRDSVIKANRMLSRALKSERSANIRRMKSIRRIMSAQFNDLNSQLTKVTASYNTTKAVNNRVKKVNESLKDSNLKYKEKINSTTEMLSDKDRTIARLKSDIRETVTAASELESRTSNWDEKIAQLKDKISAAENLIQEYQDAYVSLYTNALGIQPGGITVTSSTSVKELQDKITGSISSVDHQLDITESDVIDFVDSDNDDTNLVTL